MADHITRYDSMPIPPIEANTEWWGGGPPGFRLGGPGVRGSLGAARARRRHEPDDDGDRGDPRPTHATAQGTRDDGHRCGCHGVPRATPDLPGEPGIGAVRFPAPSSKKGVRLIDNAILSEVPR